ncbi:DUF5689 domain-containing protein [Pedobacter hiemivivus]|uniref:DUF5689 domain-containing protein n=1 Tax=Pedobacter hiemivivus TaxID=2530454 RepID=A0A4R0N663_9SPHI|nr:DUF5689 domain-containing protein [Pedobacter hiemivivus]TCC95501.1 hypothetical protein EZ444_15330 [Pedobacter hiemivivus]
MRKNIISYLILIAAVSIWTGCKHTDTYEGGEISTFISNFDLRKIYKGAEVTLTTKNMRSATSLRGLVVSDHSGGNMPVGLLVIQNTRPVGVIDSVRGISIAIGADAANYVPGDSVHVKIEGAVLTRRDGILQITGVPSSAITKVAANRPVILRGATSTAIMARPEDYESTLVTIVKGSFEPLSVPTDTYGGDKMINDGFDNFLMRTAATATFANATGIYQNANYTGVIFNSVGQDGRLTPYTRIRTLQDVRQKTLTPAAMVISGYMSDVEDGDGNYEYIQFLATKDINFATTPFSVVVSNNAGATLPQGFPTLGWATGSLVTTGTTVSKTYKMNLTSGTVVKGQYFYVGGSNKFINGSGSTSTSALKWIRSFNYTTTAGDGFGIKTGGLMANSGNGWGIAVFTGTTVTENTLPIDVIFIHNGGDLYNPGSTQGYRVANNDFYDAADPITDVPQPYYLMLGNTKNLKYALPADEGLWNMLGGVYNDVLGKWSKARFQTDLDFEKNTPASALESKWIREFKDENGVVVKTEELFPTKLRSQL